MSSAATDHQSLSTEPLWFESPGRNDEPIRIGDFRITVESRAIPGVGRIAVASPVILAAATLSSGALAMGWLGGHAGPIPATGRLPVHSGLAAEPRFAGLQAALAVETEMAARNDVRTAARVTALQAVVAKTSTNRANSAGGAGPGATPHPAGAPRNRAPSVKTAVRPWRWDRPTHSHHTRPTPTTPVAPVDPAGPKGTNDPSTTDPGTANQGATDPSTIDPATANQGTTDPSTTDPATANQGTTDPGTTDGGDDSTLQPSTDNVGVTGLTVSAATASGATLGWAASTDSVGVTSYVVYANGVQVGQVAATSLALTGLACGTSYVFGVAAQDASGNRSPQASATASTAACAAPASTAPVPVPVPVPDGNSSSGSRVGNVFVAPNGSDSGAGCVRSSSAGGFPANPAAVCGSFMKAYSLAQPGDTILVGPGTYPATSIQQAVNGAVDFQCSSASAGACTVNGELDLGANNGSASGNAPSNLTLDGINITNGTLIGFYNAGAAPTNLTFENARISDTQDAGGSGIRLNSFQGALIQNVEVGPICCDADGIDIAIPREGAPSPSGITLDSVNVHDVYDSCTLLTAQLPGTACSGLGFEDPGCPDCSHVDGTQWFGGLNSTIKNSTFTAINPGGTAGQGIFFQSANSGLFSNLTITGNTLGETPNNDFSISGPGTSVVSGTVTLTGNHIAGKMLLYNSIFAPGTTINVTGNVATTFATTPSNGCSLLLGDGSAYTPIYSGNSFGNNQCQG